MRRIAFVNEKGGTCKTTLCVNTAAWIVAQRGKRVLVADLDTQGHAGKALGIDVRGLAPTIRDVLVGESLSVKDVARPVGFSVGVVPLPELAIPQRGGLRDTPRAQPTRESGAV